MSHTLSRRSLLAGIAAGPVLALLPAAVRADDVEGADSFRFIPVRFHLLHSRAAKELDTRLTQAEVRRTLNRVNEIWRPAGIQFWAESILTEEAAAGDLYAALGENRTEAHLKLVRPRLSLSEKVFHVYFIREMRPNGYCLDGSYQMVFVKETARLEKVKGGGDDPVARVLAHELGHALNLDHRQETYNLMASGTTGITLNAEEIKTARKAAEGFTFNLKPAAALDHADRTAPADPKAAESLYSALAGLPEGDVAATARQRLEP